VQHVAHEGQHFGLLGAVLPLDRDVLVVALRVVLDEVLAEGAAAPVVQGHLARDMLQLPAQGGEANQAAGVGIHRQAAAQLVGGQRPGPADPELGLLAPSAEGVDLLQFRDVFLLDGRAQAA